MKKCYLLLFIAIFILNTIATGQKQAIDFISISSGQEFQLEILVAKIYLIHRLALPEQDTMLILQLDS